MALAAASNAASCRPSATSASGVPLTVSGTDQTTFRVRIELAPDARHPAQSRKIVPGRIWHRSRRPAPRTAAGSAISPSPARYVRDPRAPSSRTRRQASAASKRRAAALGHHRRRPRSRPAVIATSTAAFHRARPRRSGNPVSARHYPPSPVCRGKRAASLRPISTDPSAVRWPASNCRGMSPSANSSQRPSRHTES